MRGKATGKRKATDIFGGAPSLQQPSVEHHRHLVNSRDSDASFASSRPSSVGLSRDPYSDRSQAIRSINTFLASHNFPISLRASPVPPVKDISETLKFLLSTVDFPCDALKWDEDVYARYRQHLSSSPASADANSMQCFGFQSFRHFIRNEDDMVTDLDSDFFGKLEGEKASIAETIVNCEKVSGELEAKLDALRKGPSKKEALERVKADFEKDFNKFCTMVTERSERTRGMEKVLEEKEREVIAKEEERGRISEENEELRRVWRNRVLIDGWEQKAWELNSKIRNQFHQIQTLAIDCNQAMRRLKVDVQFVVNGRGVEPGEVMGVDYKAVVKPDLCSLCDGIKEGSMKKVQELVTLQEHASEMAAKIESRKRLLGSIQLQITEVEDKMRIVKKEAQELAAKCDLEAKTMAGGLEN
uniref:Kinetochore protein NDC80 n=1 Tax=Brassica oleracea var. oleracea TaxID=109376 RepID=A0A0D3CTU7_BRAOL